MKSIAITAAFAGLWLIAAPVFAQTAPPPPADYADPANWLCRPGRADACAVDLSSTIVSASGSMRRVDYRPAAKPAVDCFYVYPTTSLDPGPVSDLVAGREERRVIADQFARFGAVCRTFSPLYRQVTMATLSKATRSGSRVAPELQEIGYADVLAAWRYYLSHDNQGRGVVLIGHSQGASVLTRLLAEEIDGKPDQARLVSAMLIGETVRVKPGSDTGGAFNTLPLCRSQSQTGCIITFAAYRDTLPPVDGASFGRNGEAGLAACTNPADLRSGKGEADAYLVATVRGSDFMVGTPDWAGPNKPVGTPYVQVPGLISTECRSDAYGSWLSVHINANPADPRADDINGDLLVMGQVAGGVGLHLIDMELAQGDLISIVAKQAKAWRPRR